MSGTYHGNPMANTSPAGQRCAFRSLAGAVRGDRGGNLRARRCRLFHRARAAHRAGCSTRRIHTVRHEHDDHGEHLPSSIGSRAASLPTGACRTWQALYAGLAKLEEDLMQHIHLENNVLFPRFSA
jgi:hypothetical protein